MVLEQMSLDEAFYNAFDDFKPAILLFQRHGAVSVQLDHSDRCCRSGSDRRHLKKLELRRSFSPRHRLRHRAGSTPTPRPASERPGGEFFDHSFSGAVQHIGGYSGVLCAMLIDAEGLPVATWSRGEWDQDLWGALGKKIIDDVLETNIRAGTTPLKTIEYKSGGHTDSCSIAPPTCGCLSIADVDSDELEKIRLHQAAEMIERHCQEKFSNVYSSETGRQYAGSTV